LYSKANNLNSELLINFSRFILAIDLVHLASKCGRTSLVTNNKNKVKENKRVTAEPAFTNKLTLNARRDLPQVALRKPITYINPNKELTRLISSADELCQFNKKTEKIQSNKLQMFYIRDVYNFIYTIGHDFGPLPDETKRQKF